MELKLKKLTILIPAYNEEESILRVLASVPTKFDGVGNVNIVVINDGSKDNTRQIVESSGLAKVISHLNNRGLGASFHTGVEHALNHSSDAVVTLDADGQFDANEINKIILPILENRADFVSGSRFVDPKYTPETMPSMRVAGNKIVSWLISFITKRKFYDVSCGFRAYNREALMNLNLFGSFTYTQEVFLDLTLKNLRIVEVPVNVRYYQQRESRVARNLFSYAWRILSIIFSSIRDYKPVTFFGLIGSLFFLIGLGFDIFILSYFISTGAFTPYKAVGVAGISLNFFGLAIIGLGFVAGMFARIRLNQEKILYQMKRTEFQKNNIDES